MNSSPETISTISLGLEVNRQVEEILSTDFDKHSDARPGGRDGLVTAGGVFFCSAPDEFLVEVRDNDITEEFLTVVAW